MRIIISTIIFITLYPLSAQSDSTKTQGEIITGEVVIEKDTKITLPQADKIFMRSDSRDFGSEPINVSFQINEPTFEWPDYKSDVPFRTLVESYPLENYQNYVKLGYGNYSSPLFEAGLFQSIGSFDTQAKLFYESFGSGPVNEANSSNADGGVELSGSYRNRAKTISITPSITYQNSQYSFYGNTDRANTGFDSADPADITLSSFATTIAVSGKVNDISYSVKPSFTFVNQNINIGSGLNKEASFGSTASLDYKIDEVFNTGLAIEGQSGTYKGGLEYDRSLINVHPWVSYRKEALSLSAGFMISSGKVGDQSETGFYPRARLDYELTDDWSVYGIISGGQSWNSLNDLLNQNQFLDDSLAITQAEYTSQFGGGIKGSPFKNVLLDAKLTYSSIKGLPFYVPSSTDSSRYSLAYDSESVGVVTLNSSLSFMPTTTSTYGLSLEMNGYSVELLDRPWHKPAYEFKAYTSHNIQEKLIVSAYLTSIGGIRAPANVDFGYIKLSAFTDLGLCAKYLITRQASIFIDVNNLLNKEYERYLGYPTRGLAFKIGGQYRF